MLTVLFEGTCPKCGCHDIRNEMWYMRCFKCGYVETYNHDVSQKWEDSCVTISKQEISDNICRS